MHRIVVDAELLGKLHELTAPLEFVDSSGRLLGRFFPIPDPALFEDLEPQISEEEIQRRLAYKGKTYTTAEVLAQSEEPGEPVMFRVEWLPTALEELTTAWLQADSATRQAITSITPAIDFELAVDPFRQSESREGDKRIFFPYPLAILFEVNLTEYVVWVLHVWHYHRRAR